MQLYWIDISIIVLYMLATIFVGFWVSKRASQSIKHYFLGGNVLPWYMLGVSNASGMFDTPAPCGWSISLQRMD
jgi:SSS family solute:Na+ symporter